MFGEYSDIYIEELTMFVVGFSIPAIVLSVIVFAVEAAVYRTTLSLFKLGVYHLAAIGASSLAYSLSMVLSDLTALMISWALVIAVFSVLCKLRSWTCQRLGMGREPYVLKVVLPVAAVSGFPFLFLGYMTALSGANFSY